MFEKDAKSWMTVQLVSNVYAGNWNFLAYSQRPKKWKSDKKVKMKIKESRVHAVIVRPREMIVGRLLHNKRVIGQCPRYPKCYWQQMKIYELTSDETDRVESVV